jgi:rubrerythrin
MKNVFKLLITVVALSLMYGCAQKPVQTIANLKAAFNGESNASAKYAAFAEKAKAEGFDTAAVMFLAISKAESIHADNHKKVLMKLGEKIEGAVIEPFNTLSSVENLAAAIKGETYEIETMYPEFLATAEKEKCSDAVKSFTWAVDTEKKHQAFYKTALDALNAGGEKTLAVQWFVCPVCGNTYDATTVTTACDFCMTVKEKFVVF